MWQGYMFSNKSSQFNSQSAAFPEQVRNETLLMLMHYFSRKKFSTVKNILAL